MTRAGIVVVSYNSADVLGECLDNCRRLEDWDIVVVDNASTDRSREVAGGRSGVRVIANAANEGFAAAVNQGFEALETETVLILNPDVSPLEGLGALAGAALSPGVGAAAGRLVGADGETQHGFNVRGFPTHWTLVFEVLGLNRLWPGNPVNCRYRQIAPLDRISDVEQPAAAFLMVSRRAWEEVGGLDEGFRPVWFEDVDFCRRLHERGYRILHVPGAVARHVGGHSAAKLAWGARQVFWYGSLLRYAAKHFRSRPRCTVSLAVMLASIGRTVHGVAVRASLEPVSVYSRVFRLACHCCTTGGRTRAGAGGPPAMKENRRFSGRS